MTCSRRSAARRPGLGEMDRYVNRLDDAATSGDASAQTISRTLVTRHCPRPPDRCRGLAVEDHTQGWRVAPSQTRPQGAPLDCDLARREDARHGGRTSPVTAGAPIGAA